MNKINEYESVDIVIVGAGLAGSLLLSEIVDHFANIALLDSGANVQFSMKDIVCTGDFFHPPGDKYRCFGLGGSSSKWAGRCVLYDRQDFELSDKWPIDYDELYKYYGRALRLLDADIRCDDIEKLVDITGPLFHVNQTRFGYSFDIYSKPTDTYKKFSATFNVTRGLKIYQDHVVTSLDCCDEKVKIVSGVSSDGSFSIRAKYVVLCSGGLEVTKLLLNLKNSQKISTSPALGKYYMTHYAGTVGNFRAEPSKINYGYGKKDDVHVRLKYLYKKKTKNDLSFTARIHFPDIDDPVHSSGILSFLYLFRKVVGYEYGLRLVKTKMSMNYKHVINMVIHPLDLLKDLYALIIGRYFLDRKTPPLMQASSPYFNLDIHCEQSPTWDSNISLSDDIDDYGLYKLKVNWQPDSADLDNLADNIQDLIGQVGVNCDYHSKPSKDEIISELLRHGAFGGHFIGTTRMGNDEAKSVVDIDLKLHGLDNIYILSSSIFPTSSHANPSLTIAAFAVRLADYLKSER